MSKVTVEIDMPESCDACPFFRVDCEEKYDYNYEEELDYFGLRCENICNLDFLIDFDEIDISKDRPENCPLNILKIRG